MYVILKNQKTIKKLTQINTKQHQQD